MQGVVFIEDGNWLQKLSFLQPLFFYRRHQRSGSREKRGQVGPKDFKKKNWYIEMHFQVDAPWMEAR